MDLYKSTIDDYNNERASMMKEKDSLFKEFMAVKKFIPEFEQMEKAPNKVKYLYDMKERCSDKEYYDYLQ